MLEVPTSPIYSCFGREFVEWRDPSTATIEGPLYFVVVANL